MKKKLKINNWEVCCNEMVSALVDSRISFKIDPSFVLYIESIERELSFCPWCGVKTGGH